MQRGLYTKARGKFRTGGHQALIQSLEMRTLLGAHALFPGEQVPLNALPYSSTVADLNSDGRLDLAVAHGTAPVEILLGNGDGTFSQGVSQSFAGLLIAAADFNNDHRSDLVTVDSNGNLTIALSHGDGTFQVLPPRALGAPLTSLQAADVDGDKNIDIVGASPTTATVKVAFGRGSGYISAIRDLGSGHAPAAALAISDVNGTTTNARMDIYAANKDGTVSYFEQSFGARVFYSAYTREVTTSLAGIATGPITLASSKDLVVYQNTSSGGHVFALSGAGRMTSLGAFDVATKINDATLADTNGDGLSEVVLATEAPDPSLHGSVQIAIRAGAQWSAGPVYETGISPRRVLSSDLNDDGRSDLVVLNTMGDSASILLHNPDHTFTRPAVKLVTGLPSGMAVADVNGDSLPDVLAGDKILFGTPDGSLSPPLAAFDDITRQVRPHSEVIADFNGDGAPDLAIADTYEPGVWILPGDLSGFFGPGTFVSLADYIDGMTVCDLNSDQIPDLLLSNRYVAGGSVLLNIGNGAFTGLVRLDGMPKSASVHVSDFNSDSIPDVAYTAFGENKLFVRYGTGDGNLSDAVGYLVANPGDGNVGFLAPGDLNADGLPDLVLGINAPADDIIIGMMGQADGTFVKQTLGSLGARRMPGRILVDDVDGDGKQDIIAINTGTGDISVLLAQGDAVFGPVSLYMAGDDISTAALADMNGDAKPDLLAANSADGSISLLTNKAPLLPIIGVQGKTVVVPTGDLTPSATDGTDFGTVYVNFHGHSTFTIANTGSSELTFPAQSRITITGDGASAFRIEDMPAYPIPAGLSANFTIEFTPTTSKVYTATVTINSDDPTATAFTYTISGRGLFAPPPKAKLTSQTIIKAGLSNHFMWVKYTGPFDIRYGTIGTGDLLVTGPHGFRQKAFLIKRSTGTTGRQMIAVYRIAPPGGVWDRADNGRYTISILNGAVADIRRAFVPAGVLGSFTVNIKA